MIDSEDRDSSSMAEPIDANVMYRLLVQSVSDHAIYMLDKDGTVLNWNTGAERLKGYAASEIVGRNYNLFHSSEDRGGGLPRRNLEVALREGRYAAEGWRYRKDGSAFWASVMIEVIRDERGAFVAFAKITRDLTEKRTAELKVQHQATHDALTCILNRRGLTERLEQAIEQPSAASVALFYIDLDRFKPVNDGYGHAVGDQVLIETAKRLKTIAGEEGTVGRLGGDEFAVILRDLADDEIASTGEAIVKALGQRIRVEGNTFEIGCSVGISVAPHDGSVASAILRHADLALHRAKFDGRRCVRRYDTAMSEAALARSNLEHRLRQSLAREEFTLLYQPIVDGGDGAVVGYEALIRWTDEAGTEVGPTTFIPLAETLGLMPDIGEWTLRTACRAAAKWPGELYVSVNLSATQFRDPPLANMVIRTLIEAGLPAKRLMLEITETSVLDDLAGAKQALKRLRDIGVGIALDDFGTGFSSLSLVQELPLTCIKIDRSFIAADDEEHAQAFIRSVAALSTGYSLCTVAEGVETEEQRQLLLANGCAKMQGYLFGKPSPNPHPVSPPHRFMKIRHAMRDELPVVTAVSPIRYSSRTLSVTRLRN